jgi:hypothetical protein
VSRDSPGLLILATRSVTYNCTHASSGRYNGRGSVAVLASIHIRFACSRLLITRHNSSRLIARRDSSRLLIARHNSSRLLIARRDSSGLLTSSIRWPALSSLESTKGKSNSPLTLPSCELLA